MLTSHSVHSFAAAASLVRERTGLVFGGVRQASFEGAVMQAMHREGLEDLQVYLARLAARTGMLDDLVARITVGETYFFREPRQLDLIRKEILPELGSRRPPGHRLRIWSAGCATGEEPYTLAIIAGQLGLKPRPCILATDISRSALARAARACYSRWALRGVPEEVVQAHFGRRRDRFELAPALRGAVEFGYLNLAEDTYPSLAAGIWGMDLIVCRNVLIYFDAETVGRVARRLLDTLAEGGWLLLGASDPLLGQLASCEVVVTSAGLAYRRPSRDFIPRVTAPPLPAPEPRRFDPARQESRGARPPAAPTVVRPRAMPLEESEGLAAAKRAYAARDYERAELVAGWLVEDRERSSPAPWILLIRALSNRGDLETAGRRCAAALERHRDCAELLYLHAVLLAEAARHAEAARAARAALYLDRGLVVAHVALGTASARMGDRAGARRAFRNAERLLRGMAPETPVPASDGEPAGRLAAMMRVQLELLTGTTD